MALTNLSSSLIQDTYERLVQVEGGVLADGSGSLLTSLDITATSASHVDNAMYTGSISGNTLTFTKGDSSSFDIDLSSVSPDLSGLNAFTASADLRLDSLEAETGSLQSQIDGIVSGTGSYATVAELNASSSVLQSQITANTNDIATNAGDISTNTSNISSLQTSVTALNLETGSLQSQIDSLAGATGSYATKAELNASSSALISGYEAADTALSSSLAADIATNTSDIATNTSNISSNTTRIGNLEAETGSYAKTNVNNVFTGNQTFTDITVNGTGSFAYIQQVTGSAKIIGDAYIILNNDTPTERYAGVKVYDSGSTQNTASFEFDGQTNDWFYEYTDDGGATAEFGVVMFGPGYNTRGSHVYPSNNTILKGTGDHHIVDSIITDDGSTVTVAGDISGSVIEASTYFAGDLIGTASLATTANTVNVTNSSANGTFRVAFTPTSGNPSLILRDSANDFNYNPATNTLSVANLIGNASTATTATSASYALTASYAANVPTGEATAETGNILFSNINGEIYGSAASPVTGNITVDGASTKVDGAVAIIYHNDASEPTVSGATVNKKQGIYESGSLNIITLTNIDGTNILEYIVGGDITSVASASYATFAASSPTPSLQSVTTVGSLTSSSLETSDGSTSTATLYGDGTTLEFYSSDDSTAQRIAFSDSEGGFFGELNFDPASGDVNVIGSTVALQSIKYPSSDGTTGQVIKTDGAGNLSFGDADTATSASYALSASYTEYAIVNRTDTYTGTAGVNFVITLTQAEYDAIGTPDANTFYVIV